MFVEVFYLLLVSVVGAVLLLAVAGVITALSRLRGGVKWFGQQ